GWALWLAGFVGINRSDRRQAFRRLDRTAERVRRGASVIVFAEGTRSRDGRLLPFKKGPFVLAIRSGVPILPVAVRGGRAVLRKGSLRIRPGVMEVVFGDPIPTAGYSYEQRDLLIDRVRRAIEALLGSGVPEGAAGRFAATK
ncbi:MAG: 1-acyl-sn-glycerol-3-phosphate acyltransferase, partial [Acidobacteria bacterium]|nr:1-acyl-sn-glycerol-3-phosphate acyltransferase [Acidobacteriota bacterium]